MPAKRKALVTNRSVEEKFEFNISYWIQFVKSSDFIQHIPSKNATPELVSALKLFQELFPISQEEALAPLFTEQMKAAAEAIWKDKLTSLPPIAGKSCSEIVTQWSREEGILPPDAKKLINQHFFTVTEDDGDQHIEAKLTAWFWQFVAQNYANKKSITVPQLRLCCKAFEMNTATGSTKTQLAHAAIGCIWMFLRLDSDSPYKFQDKKAQALMKAVEAEFNNKNESTTPKKQKSTATSSPAKEIGTSTEPTLPPTEEAATTLADRKSVV